MLDCGMWDVTRGGQNLKLWRGLNPKESRKVNESFTTKGPKKRVNTQEFRKAK